MKNLYIRGVVTGIIAWVVFYLGGRFIIGLSLKDAICLAIIAAIFGGVMVNHLKEPVTWYAFAIVGSGVVLNAVKIPGWLAWILALVGTMIAATIIDYVVKRKRTKRDKK